MGSVRRGSKYHAHKVKNEYGTFDSNKEYARWCVLKRLQEDGVISELERQKRYVLIPAQREPDTVGPKGGIRKGKLIERECVYIADFVYFNNKSGAYVVEDCKGFRTTEYKIKKKLMLYVHGIRVEES